MAHTLLTHDDEASFYIYDRPVTDINEIASACGLKL